MTRCDWSLGHDLLMEYHDNEWGVPLHNDQKLFEFLILEGAQAGLSWLTILKRREGYRKAFDQFDAEKVARYTPEKVELLMQDAEIIRNRLKIESTIKNARSFLAIQEKYGSFDQYIWQFVEGKPIVNQYKTMKEHPTQTSISDAISKDLKKQGCTFVGSTICYAFMQAVGMVNDHLVGCFRYPQLTNLLPNVGEGGWRIEN